MSWQRLTAFGAVALICVVASACSAPSRPTPWVLVSSKSDPPQLEVLYGVNPCTSRFDRVVVDELDRSVRVRVVVRSVRQSLAKSARCGSTFRPEPLVVRLRRPLDERPLLGECDIGGPYCAALRRAVKASAR